MYVTGECTIMSPLSNYLPTGRSWLQMWLRFHGVAHLIGSLDWISAKAHRITHRLRLVWRPKSSEGRSLLMMIVGCDFHPSFQQVAVLNTEAGEVVEQKLTHAAGEAETF